MKTLEITNQIMETLQPVFVELKQKIELYHEDKWKLFENANLMVGFDSGYHAACALSDKSTKQYIDLYTRIANGEYKNTSCSIEEALNKIQYYKEVYVRVSVHNHQLAARNLYYEAIGYDKSKSYADKHNRLVMKSDAAHLVANMQKGRKSFNMKVNSTIKNSIAIAKSKLIANIEKYISPIADNIKSIKLNYYDMSYGVAVGIWELYMNDGSMIIFKTQCIEAGGYNIQCFHHRYICSLKKLL